MGGKYGTKETLNWVQGLRSDFNLRPRSAGTGVRSRTTRTRPHWAPRPFSATTLILPATGGRMERHTCLASRRAVSLGSTVQRRHGGPAHIRKEAAEELRDMKKAGETVAHTLAEALCFDSNTEVKQAASSALCAMGSIGAAASARMLQAQLSDDALERIAGVMGEVGDEAGPWAHDLSYVLEGKQSQPHKAAAKALGKLGPAGVAELIRTIGEPGVGADRVACRRAAEVLRDMHAMRKDDTQKSRSVSNFFEDMHASTDLTEVTRALAENDPYQRRAAAVVLGEMFYQSTETKLSMDPAKEDDWHTQMQAARALGAIEAGDLVAQRRRHSGLWGPEENRRKSKVRVRLSDTERLHHIDLSSMSTLRNHDDDPIASCAYDLSTVSTWKM